MVENNKYNILIAIVMVIAVGVIFGVGIKIRQNEVVEEQKKIEAEAVSSSAVSGSAIEDTELNDVTTTDIDEITERNEKEEQEKYIPMCKTEFNKDKLTTKEVKKLFKTKDKGKIKFYKSVINETDKETLFLILPNWLTLDMDSKQLFIDFIKAGIFTKNEVIYAGGDEAEIDIFLGDDNGDK